MAAGNHLAPPPVTPSAVHRALAMDDPPSRAGHISSPPTSRVKGIPRI